MADKALEAKNKGNAAFQAGDFATSVTHFTEAIEHDPSNHILYSNRSGSYCAMKKYAEALTDAEKTIQLKSDWAKGYGRAGAALFGLKKYEESIEAYDKGLEIEPNNAQLQKGRQEVEQYADSSMGEDGDMFANILKGDIWTKLRTNPKTKNYCDQPDFQQLVAKIQANPKLLGELLAKDPRVAAILGALLGIDMQTAAPGGDFPSPMETEPKQEEKPKPKPKEEPKQPEKELPENKKSAIAEKDLGTVAYRKRDFETALAHYNKAAELDPEDISYLTNRAAVLFEQGKFDECVKECQDAIALGRKIFADFKLIAKAYARIGNAQVKKGELKEAIESYNKSLTENRTPEVLASLQKTEKALKEKEIKDYINPEQAIVEKEKGNEFFKKQQFPEAIKAYSEAIKRNPSDPVLWTNRATAYTKLSEYTLAIKDCDESIKLKPEYVKAYIKKGNCQFFMREYHKCLETYELGQKHDPNNTELKEGMEKTMRAISAQNYDQSESEEDRQKRAARAMSDPEIASILNDPVMMNILQDMQQDPKAAANHMRNPMIAGKINKLIASGILKTG